MGEPTWGSAEHHRRVMAPGARLRRKCRCGCNGWATHYGTANGVVLMAGCEWAVRRWVKEQDARRLTCALLEVEWDGDDG